MQRFTIQSIADSIHDKTRDILATHRRILTQSTCQLLGATHRVIGRGVTSNQLHEPRRMSRLGPVHTDETIGVPACCLQYADRNRRGIAGHNRIPLHDLLDVIKHGSFYCQIVRYAFNHKATGTQRFIVRDLRQTQTPRIA